jgi:hypothetical protein
MRDTDQSHRAMHRMRVSWRQLQLAAVSARESGEGIRVRLRTASCGSRAFLNARW